MNTPHLPDKAMLGYKALRGSKGLLNILSKSASPLQVSGLLGNRAGAHPLQTAEAEWRSLSFRSVDIENTERNRRDVAVTDSSSLPQPPAR